MRYIIITVVCVLLMGQGFAQQRAIDSLEQLIATAKPDTNKVWWMLRTGSMYRGSDLKKAHAYADAARTLSKQIDYKTGQLKSLILKLALFRVEGNNDSCLAYNKTFLNLAKQFNDTVHMGIGYVNIADSYNDFSDEEAALESALAGLKIIEQSNHTGLKQGTYDLLLRLYFTRFEYDKALEYGQKAIAEARKMESAEKEAATLVNIAEIYDEKKEFAKSISTAQKAIELSKDDPSVSERYEAYALATITDCYLKLNNITAARTASQRSLLLARKSGDRSMEGVQLRALAICYLQTKDFRNAQVYADSSLAVIKQLADAEQEITTTKVLADIAYATGDPAKGYALERLCDEYQEKHVRQVLSKQSSDLEKKYETEKKESQIKELQAERQVQLLTIQKKNTLNYILIGSAIIILALSALSYANYRQKQKLQQQRITELERERQLMATEAVLKGEEQERTRLARDLHDGLGGMLSGIKYALNTMKGNLIMTPENAQAFERSMDMLDSSIKEMRRVAHNMMPEALVKFGLDTALKDFCNEINQTGALQVSYQSFGLDGDQIDQSTAIIIYRVVQELINNTIKHAAAKSAIVQLSKTNDQLSITVEDDGKGFDTTILNIEKGIGWSNIKHRIEFLKGRLDVNSQAGNGTSVLIELTV